MDAYNNLQKWREDNGLSVAQLAHVLNVSEVTVYAWGNLRRRPSLAVAALIEAVADIPAASWAKPRDLAGAFKRLEKVSK